MNTRGKCVVVLHKILGREEVLYVSIPYPRFVADDEKWEIKPLAAGYSVQRVSVPVPLLSCVELET